MTREELGAWEALHEDLVARCPFWSRQDWAAFMGAPEADQRAIAQALDLSAEGSGVDVVGGALELLELAADVLPVPGVRTGAKVLREILGR